MSRAADDTDHPHQRRRSPSAPLWRTVRIDQSRAGDAEPRIGIERSDNRAECAGLDDRVAIQQKNDASLRGFDAAIRRCGESAIAFETYDSHSRSFDREQLRGSVARSVVRDNDLRVIGHGSQYGLTTSQ